MILSDSSAILGCNNWVVLTEFHTSQFSAAVCPILTPNLVLLPYMVYYKNNYWLQR